MGSDRVGTEIQWVKDVPPHWNVVQLRRLAGLIQTGPFGSQLHSHEYVENGWPLVNPANINEGRILPNWQMTVDEETKQRLSRYTLDVGDIVLGRRGDMGRAACVGERESGWLCGTGSIMIRVQNPALHPEFLTNYIRLPHIKDYLTVESVGTTMDNLNADIVGRIPVVVPPVEEQFEIVAFLDAKTAEIDAAIAKKARLIQLLHEQKAILINRAVTRGLNPAAPLRDSGVPWIGEVPAHWEVRRVKHIFRLIVDPAPANNDFELLSIYTDIGVRPRKELQERGNRASNTDGYWLVKKGDFIVNKLLAWMGAIGLSEYEGVTSPAYDILRPILPIAGYYYHHLFRTSMCLSELKKHSRGIMDMRLRLYFDKFGVVMVPYPPVDEQHAISNFLDEIETQYSDLIGKIEREIELLQEFRSILIAEAVTGKIKVAT